ncbi:MAG: choloylglycine hydrolase [Acetatifactor sp.]|nr:choloylglycine hydrolase [Acetatifactor sp.]
MCTAATYQTKDFYFGRTLDYEFSYGEEITVTPRNYPFHFRHMGSMGHHYAIIGMAHVEEDYPLYYDAVNEKGLAMAGLNFVGNADYKEEMAGRDNVAVFELINWILAQCATVRETRALLERMNLVGTVFNDKLPTAQLHWIIADREEAITLESVREGIRVYDNPVGVLTNNPPFDMQMFQLNQYMNLSPATPVNHFSDKLELHAYSRGMGALGLPGDLSSTSRFVRVAFTKMNSISGDSEEESVSQFFHILGSVDQQRGCCELEEGKYEITIYTSCCNADKGIYYYTTYDNHQITAVDMHREELDGSTLSRYPMIRGEQIRFQNQAG